MLHALAIRLGKTLAELDSMPFAEFESWIAFFAIEAEEREP